MKPNDRVRVTIGDEQLEGNVQWLGSGCVRVATKNGGVVAVKESQVEELADDEVLDGDDGLS